VRVYVESNFVLEIVWEQEQEGPARRLLELAGEGSIELVIPAFALVEPHWTRQRRSTNRKAHLQRLVNEQRNLMRSSARAEVVVTVNRLIDQIGRMDAADDASHQNLVAHMAKTCRVLKLDGQEIMEGISVQAQTGLKYFDALMLATIVVDLGSSRPTGECAFVSRDSRAFDDPMVRKLLADLGCRYLASFDDAVRLALAGSRR
jgi:predicted nucleic acid-binding protein